ncbi:MAG: ASKHA domain-containing protein, partial [Desulfitobacteriaceae bacterium]
PSVPEEKIQSVGNAAGAGAQLALISQGVRERSVEIARQVVHVELSSRSDFQEKFIEAFDDFLLFDDIGYDLNFSLNVYETGVCI